MPWWTETNGVWAQAVGLVITLLLQFVLIALTLREQRAARLERRKSEIARQRGETTCAGITQILRTLSEAEMCKHLWAGNFKHAGFAFERELHMQLPEYLARKCEAFSHQINEPISAAQLKTARHLLVFRFPYPEYDAILDDVNRLNFGNVILVWNESGKPVSVKRD